MRKKNSIIIIAAIVIVIISAVGIYSLTDDNSSHATYVTYNGNGGTTSESETTFTSTSEAVQTCMFTYNSYVFDSWNTKADGSGTEYATGESIAYGTTLYAQWTETYSVTSCSIDVGPLTLIFNDETVDTSAFDIAFPPVTSPSVITLVGDSGWSYDSITHVFSCIDDNKTCTLTITVTGTNDVTYALVNDVPTVTLETTDNIGLNVIYLISE
jgi:hypothetical protein